ncbi:flagellar basal body P-ring protein FlgI [Helicobacter magdeburgensis]|uniref:Flagellar P-ring protein n=1 Tax=Helicobacter magdeburgensis TaxID=471858 RepID=A0A4U8T296_9HELI|nr:flagellar basal body P-ring protein FlgI [Helicobacter magdeburgensis]
MRQVELSQFRLNQRLNQVKLSKIKLVLIAFWLVFGISALYGQKISQITQVVGIRDNSLVGYGLVIGLNGTGDKSGSKFTMQSIANMLESVNVKLSANDIKSKNVAAVMVTASLPPFARQGDKLDILVSSIGDAKSISGGTLVMTPLTGVDGNIYALAQGNITMGESGSVLSGRIVGGASVEREINYNLYNQENATLSLKSSDLQNAIKIQQTLNSVFSDAIAVAVDARTIKLKKPENLSMVEFLALVEEVEIDYSRKEKIIIDEKTGTIVAGVGISIDPVVVTHGDITIKISDEILEDPEVTKLDNDVVMSKSQGTIASVNGTKPTVSSVVKALQKMGATPKNIISILENIKKSGALRADIEVM